RLLSRGLCAVGGGHLAVLGPHQRRNREDAVFRRRFRVLVDIELDDLVLAAHRHRDLLERRRDHAAGTAPFSPEIDHHRLAGLQDLSLGRRVGNLANAHETPLLLLKALRRPTGGVCQTYGRPPGASRHAHRRVTRSTARSRVWPGISMKSGTSVHTRIARTEYPG